MDSLFNYSQYNWKIDYDGNENYQRNQNAYYAIALKLLNIVPTNNSFPRPVNLKDKTDVIQEFYNWAGANSYSVKAYISFIQVQQIHAKNLIQLLEKEYNLEDK